MDWETTYAGYHHSYAPPFRRIANALLGGSSCSGTIRRLRPFVPLAVQIIPEELKIKVPPVQPSDWTRLPNDQIRRLWDCRSCVFAKTVLAKAALQLLDLHMNGALGDPPLNEGGSFQDEDAVLEKIESLSLLQEHTLFAVPWVQLACYRFVGHSDTAWVKVFADNAMKSSFSSYTKQRHEKFFPSFARGDLATIRSLEVIRQWAQKEGQTKLATSRFDFVEVHDMRTTAAKREKVFEI